MSILFLSALASISVTAIPVSAPASQTSEVVTFNDLNVATASGKLRLERRIASAAAAMCAEIQGASPAPAPVDRQCYLAAIARAQTDLARVASGGSSRSAEGPTSVR